MSVGIETLGRVPKTLVGDAGCTLVMICWTAAPAIPEEYRPSAVMGGPNQVGVCCPFVASLTERRKSGRNGKMLVLKSHVVGTSMS